MVHGGRGKPLNDKIKSNEWQLNKYIEGSNVNLIEFFYKLFIN